MTIRYKKLSDCADFRDERTSQIDFETYITTDNMLPERGGVAIAESLPNAKTVSKYISGDILLSNIRPYFKKIWLADRDGGCSNDVLVVKSKKDFLPAFLFYVLSDNNFFNYDTVTSKGTKMPRGTPSAIMKYLVPDFGPEKQARIAKLLSAYDNLIEVNNKRIKVLERMAENLYKEWFVRFRFPGYETTELENCFPKSWTVVKVKEIVKRLPFGVLYKAENTEKAGKVIVIDQSQSDYVGFHNDEPSHFATSNNPIILFGDHSCKQQLMITPFSLSENVVPFVGRRDINTMYLFFLTYNLIETVEYKRHWTEFTAKKVFVAPSVLQKSFAANVTPIIEAIQTRKEQNRNLIHQRDLLLPRLMSGKLEA